MREAEDGNNTRLAVYLRAERCGELMLGHIHKWEELGFNVYGICVERRCKRCQKWQYHIIHDFDPVTGEPSWKWGRHPNNKGGKP